MSTEYKISQRSLMTSLTSKLLFFLIIKLSCELLTIKKMCLAIAAANVQPILWFHTELNGMITLATARINNRKENTWYSISMTSGHESIVNHPE